MVFNILIRTSKRPKYFDLCYKSIKIQNYKEINLIVNYDNKSTLKYLKQYSINKLTNFNLNNICENLIHLKDGKNNYHLFLYNLYFNHMYQFCEPGYIMFMDDDDVLIDSDSISLIFQHIQDTKPLIFWKVILSDGKVVPSFKNFGNKPVCEDITGQGFAFPTELVNYAQWDYYKMSDFRVAKSLWEISSNKVFINKPLIKMNRSIYGGHGKRDDLGKWNYSIFKKKIKGKTLYLEYFLNKLFNGPKP